MCEEVFGHSEKFLKLSFQAEFLLQGQAGLKNTNCHPVKKNKFSFIKRNHILDVLKIFMNA